MPYFSPFLDADGLHIPTYAERMEELLDGYKRIFGTDIYLGEDSQDYQLMSIFARQLDDVTAVLVDTYHARNPNLASDTALDHLLPLSGIRRLSATRSVVKLQLTGHPYAILSAGMQVRDTSGHVWSISSSVTFDGNGNAQAEASCLDTGAIHADVDAVSLIDTPTANWYTVTNPDPATPGTEAESDPAVRERRALSVSMPSRSIIDGIEAGLRNLSGVDYTVVVENATGAEDDNALPPHSICAVVSGGEDAEIARVLYLKKSPGVTTYGNSSALYTDEFNRHYVLRFSRPTKIPVSVQITLRMLDGWDEDYMQQAIVQAVSASVNSLGIGIGLVVPTLYGAAFTANQGDRLSFAVTGITASTPSQAATADTITASYDEQLVTDADHITLDVDWGGK